MKEGLAARIDLSLRIAAVAALFWIGYELHAAARNIDDVGSEIRQVQQNVDSIRFVLNNVREQIEALRDAIVRK